MSKKTIDYSDFLRPNGSGSIWWSVDDALKLAAGFIPLRDDSQDLNAALRAPNRRVVAHHRGLIGALQDDRFTIAKPLVVEREGVRYVEARAFFEWLSQYLTQTQSGIPFPNDLVLAVNAVPGRGVVQPVPRPRFESLVSALEGYFGKRLDELPEAARQIVEKDIFLRQWNTWDENQKRHLAEQFDYKFDPAAANERKRAEAVFSKLCELKSAIAKLECEDNHSLTRAGQTEKNRDLAKLQAQLAAMNAQFGFGGPFPINDNKQPKKQSASAGPRSRDQYFAYLKVFRLLSTRIHAISNEEVAAWVFIGPEDKVRPDGKAGGIAAFTNANELSPPPRFFFDASMGEDYVAPLMSCWFKESDVASFLPADRYVMLASPTRS